MRGPRHQFFAAVAAVVALVSCAGSATESSPTTTTSTTTTSTTTTSTTTTSVPTTTAAASAADPDTAEILSDPAVVSRRTTIDDVDVSHGGTELRAEYQRAAVPVDAWPAITVDGVATRASAAPEALIVQHSVDVCELIAVWILPHPDYVAVGYEEHPDVDCVQQNSIDVTFAIDAAGLNSEGTWSYGDTVEIREVRKFGTG